jgi:hypothetical protein
MPDSLVYSNQFYLSCCLNNILLMETLFFSWSCQFAGKVKQT